MPSKYFNRIEAEELVGNQLCTLVPCSGVPRETKCTVVGADGSNPDQFLIAVEWHLTDRIKPSVDWFTKDEHDKYLTSNEGTQ